MNLAEKRVKLHKKFHAYHVDGCNARLDYKEDCDCGLDELLAPKNELQPLDEEALFEIISVFNTKNPDRFYDPKAMKEDRILANMIVEKFGSIMTKKPEPCMSAKIDEALRLLKEIRLMQKHQSARSPIGERMMHDKFMAVINEHNNKLVNKINLEVSDDVNKQADKTVKCDCSVLNPENAKKEEPLKPLNKESVLEILREVYFPIQVIPKGATSLEDIADKFCKRFGVS